MKNIIFAILICFGLFSCSQNDQATETPSTSAISVSDLPASVTNYVTNNYPDASITGAEIVSNSTARYIADLNTNESLAFTDKGNFLGNGNNFSGPAGDKHDHGHGLHGPQGPKGECGPHGEGLHGGNGIPADSLADAIKAYISANYPGDTILHAEKDSICGDGEVTKVMVTQAGQPPVKLFFDASNNFLMTGVRVLYKDLPQAVKDYVSTNYAGYATRGKAVKLTLADSSVQYFVFLAHGRGPGEKPVIVRIKDDGTLVCSVQ